MRIEITYDDGIAIRMVHESVKVRLVVCGTSGGGWQVNVVDVEGGETKLDFNGEDLQVIVVKIADVNSRKFDVVSDEDGEATPTPISRPILPEKVVTRERGITGRRAMMRDRQR